jgi:hypothetical protein
VSLFDCDNLDLAAIHLHGLTDPLSDKPVGKWGYIGDRSAAGIRLASQTIRNVWRRTSSRKIVTCEPARFSIFWSNDDATRTRL